MTVSPDAEIGAVILCGGHSRRMGFAKARLPFGREFLLQRVADRVRAVAGGPTVIVAAEEQELPPLAESCEVVRDPHPDGGPLVGLQAGLAALADRVPYAFVSSCDAPLLQPAFVRALCDCWHENLDAVVPVEGRFHHPLAAVYRTALAVTTARLLAEGKDRPFHLLECVRTLRVETDDLRRADPELHSLRNTNTPEEYAATLRLAGIADDVPDNARGRSSPAFAEHSKSDPPADDKGTTS